MKDVKPEKKPKRQPKENDGPIWMQKETARIERKMPPMNDIMSNSEKMQPQEDQYLAIVVLVDQEVVHQAGTVPPAEQALLVHPHLLVHPQMTEW